MLNSEAGPLPDAPCQRVDDLVDVVQVTVDVQESDLRGGGERRTAALLDATETALTLLNQELGWRSAEMDDIVSELRRKRDARSDRDRVAGTAGSEDPSPSSHVYVVGDGLTAVDVAVEDEAGVELRRERVAESATMVGLEAFFPVRTAVMKDGVFVLREQDP